MRLRMTALCLALALTTACGSSSPPLQGQASESPAGDSGNENTSGTGDKKDGHGTTNPDGKGSGGGDSADGSGSGSGTGGGGGDASAGSSGSGGGSGDGGQGGGSTTASGEPSSNGSGGSALFPASGTYVYSQRGYEKFCSATCDENKLPPRQSIKSSLTGRSGDSATVVTEVSASGGRLTRTTTDYTRASADITEVYVKFAYSGYEFTQTYRPDPPVESLRFPLSPGESWSGRWSGKVSGDYKVSVLARESVGDIRAIKLDTMTNFRGDFEGKANATIWVDPRTKAVLRTAGNLNVKSNFGRYETGFATSLKSGPGY